MELNHSLTRTQIYLTQSQQNSLRLAAKASSTTKSELIRRAIDTYLAQPPAKVSVEDKRADRARRMAGIAGMWADRADMADPEEYVRRLRAPRF